MWGSRDSGGRPPGPGHPSRGRQHTDRGGAGPCDQHSADVLDARSGGGGGLAGLRDPYDRPTRSDVRGSQSRLRQDKASGALMEVAGRYRTLFGAHHIVRKGLRRSIADAYAAYVGQVVSLPDDTYGLALYALDHTYNWPRQPNGAAMADFQLGTTPFATSRAKHAQVFNTARKIMRDLEGYVYDVSYYCPGELDRLRGMRRPGAAQAAGGESYKAGPALEPGGPPLHREAVPVTPRVPTPRTARREGPHVPGVSPVTGAWRGGAGDPSVLLDGAGRPVGRWGREEAGEVPQQPRQQRRPRTAPVSGRQDGRAGDGGVAAAARDVAGALRSARRAEERERDGGSGPEDPGDWQQRRGLNRLSSPGMFVRTPPHLRVARYYDHVSPTKEVLDFMRKRALAEPQQQQQQAQAGGVVRTGPEATEAHQAAGGAGSTGGVEGHGHGQGHTGEGPDGGQVDAVQQMLAMVTGGRYGVQHRQPAGRANGRPTYSPPRQYGSPGRRYDGGYGHVPHNKTDPRYHQGPMEGSPPPQPTAPRTPGPDSRGGSPQRIQPKDPRVDPDRITWIIETAYELGLAEALGLEGPPPYGRSRRTSPVFHRRVHYKGTYSSPERYVAAYPRAYEEAVVYGGAVPPPRDGPCYGAGDVHSGQGAGEGQRYPSVPREGSPEQQQQQWEQQPSGRYGSPYGRGVVRRAPRPRYLPEGFEGPTAFRVQVAEARRYVRDVGPEPEAKRYGRSTRLRP